MDPGKNANSRVLPPETLIQWPWDGAQESEVKKPPPLIFFLSIKLNLILETELV